MISPQTDDIKKVFYGQINYAQKYQIVTTAGQLHRLTQCLEKGCLFINDENEKACVSCCVLVNNQNQKL